MASSLAVAGYSLTSQNYRLLAQRLRDQAANSCSAEIRSELESLARHYEHRANGAENLLRQSARLHLEAPVNQA